MRVPLEHEGASLAVSMLFGAISGMMDWSTLSIPSGVRTSLSRERRWSPAVRVICRYGACRCCRLCVICVLALAKRIKC